MTPLSRFWSWPLVRREQLIRLASLLCALIVIGATLSHALQLRDAIQAAAESSLRTVSRVLAKEINRSLLQTRALLDQVDEALRNEGIQRTPALDALLESMPPQQTLLREIAVVDRRGIVIASSERRHLGLDVSAYDFSQQPRDARLHVGQPKAGRTLGTVGQAGVAQGSEHAYDGFVTIARSTSEQPDEPLVVAVIGADSLIGELKFLSPEESNLVTVYRYDGTLLAASERSATARKTAHPIFADFLPTRESGGYADRPGDARIWRSHFDTTADFPVVIDVRTPQAEITQRWERELVSPLLILLVTLVAVALYTRMTAAALRQRALSEAQAATQERRLRNILDTAADGIVTIDSRGIVREYNRAAESIFGVSAPDALGQPMSGLLPEGQADADSQRLEDSLLAGTSVGRDRTLVTARRDGRPMELQLAVSEVVDQGERLFTGIVRDVTEFKQAEQRFRTLFQRSGEPHLLFVAGGMVDCNDAAAMLLRADRRELLGRRIDQLAPAMQSGGPSNEVIAGAFVEARRDGLKRLVWAARGLDGTEFPVEMTLTPIRLGAEDAMLVAWHDIAERQRYEAQLRRARDAAESAASAKAQFLAMMSHELRTPMTGIIGMVDLLHDSRMTDEQRHFVNVLRSSAHSLLTVLNDVLDYSKIEAGRLDLERIDFRPAAVAQEVVALLANAASQRGNNLVLRWRDDAVDALRGDPTRLRQVLFNLVGNAIKFTERGTVTVEGDARTQPDGRVALAFDVRDTGVGIAPEVLPTLFRPFQQADSSTTRRFGGTGLGLAICRHLVEAMGGEISVDSVPGEGSTFRFVLRLEPAGETPPRVEEPDSAPAPKVAGLRLLVAEDNPTNRLLVGTRLRRAGHRVDLVDNGLKAVEAVRGNDYDVVLMDMQMPELDGVGATRVIRALPGPAGRVPIVALTADALPEFRERYMSSGLDDYLTKPIDWKALDRVLRRYAPVGATGDADGAAPRTPGGAADTAPPPAALAAARPDAGPVAAMQEDLGEDVWGIVLEIYWSKAQGDVQGCRAAMQRGDDTALRATAHSLKGSSSSLGFESVAACAGALELAGTGAGPAAVDALDAAFESVRRAWSTGPVAAPAGG